MTERSIGGPYDLWCCSGSHQHKEDRRGACCMCSAADLLTKCPLLCAGLGGTRRPLLGAGFPGCAAVPSVLISGRRLMLKTKHSANEVGFVVTCKAKCKCGSQSILLALEDDAVTSPVLHCWAGFWSLLHHPGACRVAPWGIQTCGGGGGQMVNSGLPETKLWVG